MKLLVLLLLPLLCSAQFTGIKEIDEFTGDTRIQVNCITGKKWGGSDNIAKGLLNNVFLTAQYLKLKSTGEAGLFFTLNIHGLSNGTCLGQHDGKAMWLFEDKTTIEAKQVSETDCAAANLNGKYFISGTDLENLITKKAYKLRVYTTTGFIDYEIKDNKKQLINWTFAQLKNEVPVIVSP